MSVTLSNEEYTKLIVAQYMLNALFNGGVDNWEWYGESLQEYAECEGYSSWDEFEESIIKG